MRRKDREVTEFEKILDIVDRANTLHLGISDGEYPYVVPLSYGFEVQEGKIILYVHGASDGKKHSLIAKNPHICAEISIFHRYMETGHSVTCEYESVIGYGVAEKIFDKEAEHGIKLLLLHCGFKDNECDSAILGRMTIYKITLESFTGKRRFV